MKDGKIPRYENADYRDFEEKRSGLAEGYHGGKLIDGVIRYPEGADVDLEHAARAQAFVDYSYRPGGLPTPNDELAALYGEPYRERFEQLKTQNIIRRALDGVLHHIANFRTPNE